MTGQPSPDVADSIAANLQTSLSKPVSNLVLGRDPLRRISGAPNARVPVGTVTRKVKQIPLYQAGVDLDPHPGESTQFFLRSRLTRGFPFSGCGCLEAFFESLLVFGYLFAGLASHHWQQHLPDEPVAFKVEFDGYS